uniref:Ig-like domain-containing protein n=1 Tax=Maylandia zebra TaxID=106582 RepID=A0A3P9D1S3_9CICH
LKAMENMSQNCCGQSYRSCLSFVLLIGETVTVRCEIHGGEGAQWTYEWRPAEVNTPPTSNEYRISSAAESDSGEYSCRGRRNSSWTDAVNITVQSIQLTHEHKMRNKQDFTT